MPGSPTSRNSRPRPAAASSRPAVSSAQLALATDERAGGDLRRRRAATAREIEPRVLVEDRALELAQPLARLDPELVGQRAARVAVGLQRVGLAVAAVQREHQLRPQPLAVGVLGDQPLEPLEQVGVAAQRELGLGQQLERRDAQLLQPRDLALARTARRPDRRAAARATAPARSSSVAAARAGRPAASSLRPSPTRRSNRSGVERVRRRAASS